MPNNGIKSDGKKQPRLMPGVVPKENYLGYIDEKNSPVNLSYLNHILSVSLCVFLFIHGNDV